jgi:hypothetical protein
MVFDTPVAGDLSVCYQQDSPCGQAQALQSLWWQMRFTISSHEQGSQVGGAMIMTISHQMERGGFPYGRPQTIRERSYPRSRTRPTFGRVSRKTSQRRRVTRAENQLCIRQRALQFRAHHQRQRKRVFKEDQFKVLGDRSGSSRWIRCS